MNRYDGPCLTCGKTPRCFRFDMRCATRAVKRLEAQLAEAERDAALGRIVREMGPHAQVFEDAAVDLRRCGYTLMPGMLEALAAELRKERGR